MAFFFPFYCFQFNSTLHLYIWDIIKVSNVSVSEVTEIKNLKKINCSIDAFEVSAYVIIPDTLRV